MQFDADCLACLVEHQYQLAPGGPNDEEKLAYMKDVLRILLDAPRHVAAPYFIPLFHEAFQRHFQIDDPYAKQKADANEAALQLLPKLERFVASSEDALYASLQVSLLGNFLDFAVLSAETVQQELDKALQELSTRPIDKDTYEAFCRELSSCQHMMLIGDNAGEIVLDTILVRTLQKSYPQLQLSYCVRGGISQNDATKEDAAVSGMDRLVPIVDTGSCIPGVELACCSDAFREAFAASDLLLAKGQGNYETLMGCGSNVYYLFLCKCPRLAAIMDVPRMTGVFANENRF